MVRVQKGCWQCQPARPRRTSWHGASASATTAGGGALFSSRPSPSPSRPGTHRVAASYIWGCSLDPRGCSLEHIGLQEWPAPFSPRPAVAGTDRAESSSRGRSARWEACAKGFGELNSKASTWLRRVAVWMHAVAVWMHGAAAWMHGAAAWVHRLQPRYRLYASKDGRSEEGKDTRSEQLGVGVGKGVEGGGRGGDSPGALPAVKRRAEAEAACAGAGRGWQQGSTHLQAGALPLHRCRAERLGWCRE